MLCTTSLNFILLSHVSIPSPWSDHDDAEEWPVQRLRSALLSVGTRDEVVLKRPVLVLEHCMQSAGLTSLCELYECTSRLRRPSRPLVCTVCLRCPLHPSLPIRKLCLLSLKTQYAGGPRLEHDRYKLLAADRASQSVSWRMFSYPTVLISSQSMAVVSISASPRSCRNSAPFPTGGRLASAAPLSFLASIAYRPTLSLHLNGSIVEDTYLAFAATRQSGSDVLRARDNAIPSGWWVSVLETTAAGSGCWQ
nr:hypothetical protein CFP56_34960 [Quercus suber]